MNSENIHKKKGHRRRRGRNVVRLDAAALWLAREIGISPGYMSMLVNGERSPSGRIRRRMQKVLGVDDFNQLFTMEDRHDQH